MQNIQIILKLCVQVIKFWIQLWERNDKFVSLELIAIANIDEKTSTEDSKES